MWLRVESAQCHIFCKFRYKDLDKKGLVKIYIWSSVERFQCLIYCKSKDKDVKIKYFCKCKDDRGPVKICMKNKRFL